MTERLYFDIFVDESSQSNARYTVIGALISPRDQTANLLASLATVRERHALSRELKWGKVSRAKEGAYCEFVEAVGNHLHRNGPAYYCIIIDTTLVNNHLYNNGSRDTGFSKFLYQLLKKLARLFAVGHAKKSKAECHFYVYLDNRNTRHPPDEVKIMLNQGLWRDHQIAPFRIMEFRDSKRHDLIQWVDLVTGATAYHWNDRDAEPGASEARKCLAKSVAHIATLPTLRRESWAGMLPFSIWKMRLR